MSVKLFPIGALNATDCTGSIGDLTYTLFEPNSGCESDVIFFNISERFDNQTIHTRKKAEPYLSIRYEYDNIYAREYRQIEHFVDDVGGDLTSFLVVDWSNGETPRFVKGATGKIGIVETNRKYSDTSSYKANNVLLWNGKKFKMYTVTDSSATILTVNTSGTYGNLTATDAEEDADAYPVYSCYFSSAPLNDFTKTYYIDGDLGATGTTSPLDYVSGWMRKGTITFFSKYKVL